MSKENGCLYELVSLPFRVTKEIIAARQDRLRQSKYATDSAGAMIKAERGHISDHLDNLTEIGNSVASGESDWAHNELWKDIDEGRIK